jgi:hypothetical protein
MKRLIQRWLGLPVPDRRQDLLTLSSPRIDQDVKLRVELLEAVNGRVLQVGKYKPNPHGPDWTFTLYVVGDNETLPDAIATCMVLHG